MADVTPYTTFVIKVTEKEYALITKGLALLSGRDLKVKARQGTGEPEAAAELNLQLLEQQRHVYVEREAAASRKLEKAREANGVAELVEEPVGG